MTALLVCLAGAAGALSRYGIGLAAGASGLTWATFGINVAGSFALGLLLPFADGLSPEVRTALAVGFLGSFTTFSTFSVDGFLFLDSGRAGLAAVYLAGSVAAGVAAAFAGYELGRALN
ncbi:MAG: CrcB family protein [Actinomycetota bacterium]